jgi:hypothetical protein
MAKPIFIKLDVCIMAPEPMSTAYFIKYSHKSVCLHVYPPVVAMQRLCKKNITAAMNTHETIEEFLDAVRVVSSKVDDQLFPELLVFFTLFIAMSVVRLALSEIYEHR